MTTVRNPDRTTDAAQASGVQGALRDGATDEVPGLRRDRRVWAWVLAAAVSQAGDMAWYVGLAWTATQVTSAAGAGLVMGVGAVPRALVLLFGGALADRLDTRRTMIWSNLARIAVLLVATGVVLAGGVSLALLLVVAVVFGLVDAIYTPASGTMPRQLVRPEDLTAVAAMGQLAHRLAVFAGAPLGGVLVATGGLAGVMVADAVSFAVIAVALLTLIRPRFALPRSAGRSLLADLRDGFGYLRRAATARVLVVSLFGLNLCVGPVLAVGLVLRTRDEGWGAATLGVFQACSGLAAAAGAVVAMRWKPAYPARTGMLLLIPQAIACIAIGTVPHGFVYAAMAVIGLTAGLASAQLSGAFQVTVEPGYLGRTSSLVSLSDEALMPVAMTGFGALAGAAGPGTACLVVGVAFAALMVWSAIRLSAGPAG